ITPPVALAAFAAASITRAEPMATGFSAVKSGRVRFVIPFVFALYPEILLIDDAVIDAAASASGAVVYLAGYDGTVDIPGLALVLGRLVLALYLISSALARFDRRQLGLGEVGVRLGLAILLMTRYEFVYIGAAIAAGGLIAIHAMRRPATA
ncbi:MAG: C4-dicarboxylate ABC transporter, partial [Pseudomonadota bacterium]|nr:C4-dicarboxylate ABC transporter [Pseudomonadota bacterium]